MTGLGDCVAVSRAGGLGFVLRLVCKAEDQLLFYLEKIILDEGLDRYAYSDCNEQNLDPVRW